MKKSELRQLIKEELLKEKNTERNDDALRYAMDKDLVKSVGEFANI